MTQFFLRFAFSAVVLFSAGIQHKLYAADLNKLSPVSLLKNTIIPLHGLNDLTPVVQLIADKPYVLLGDSTHGTYEFYQQRINLTKKLIQEKNFKVIAIEADVVNTQRLNQYIHSLIPLSAVEVLNVPNPEGGAWFWNNEPMLAFIRWLKHYNKQLPAHEQQVSLFGLDIYSFESSKRQVIDYLQLFSVPAAQQAAYRYQCFSPFSNNLHRYGRAVSSDPAYSCEAAVMAQYLDFASCRFPCPQQYAAIDAQDFFFAEQNARVVKNIEKSFRLQYLSGYDLESWNQRDRHMMESLQVVMAHLQQSKAIVWAHNSHIGDARATEMHDKFQLNLGQLLRQQYPQQVFALGMLTYTGSVTAADDWDSPARVKKLLNAHPDSNEALLHFLDVPHFVLSLRQSKELIAFLNQTRLQRHVGVIYRPFDEMASHYTYTHLADQFDALIFIDHSTAVKNLPSI